MEIRLATLNDVDSISQLYHEFWQHIRSTQPQYNKKGLEDGYYPSSMILDKDSDIYVALTHGKMVGFVHINECPVDPLDCLVENRYDKYAEIVDFVVSAPYRNAGVGSKLMDAIKTWCKNRNLEYIQLFSLANTNDAIGKFRQKGFTIMFLTMRCKIR